MSKMSTDDAFGPPPASGSDKWFKMSDLASYQGNKAKLRILELPAITGWERWSAEPKPVRWRMNQAEPQGITWKVEKGPRQGPKQFWALWVYDHASGKIKAWSFTQATVIGYIRTLYENEDWGDLRDYDIALSRTGSGTETEYSVVPIKPAALPKGVAEDWAALKETCAGLDALFSGGDPHAPFGSQAKEETDSDLQF